MVGNEQDVAALLQDFEDQITEVDYPPRPTAAFVDRVGRYVVVLDNGEVWNRADIGRSAVWELVGAVPGTEADMEA